MIRMFQLLTKFSKGTKVETPGSLSHAELIKQLPKAGGPGDYTVQRLLIDFTSRPRTSYIDKYADGNSTAAKLSNPVAELSTFSIKDWKSSYTIRKGLQTLMNAHLEKTKQQETDNVGGGSLLGFVATANNPGLSRCPSFTILTNLLILSSQCTCAYICADLLQLSNGIMILPSLRTVSNDYSIPISIAKASVTKWGSVRMALQEPRASITSAIER